MSICSRKLNTNYTLYISYEAWSAPNRTMYILYLVLRLLVNHFLFLGTLSNTQKDSHVIHLGYFERVLKKREWLTNKRKTRYISLEGGILYFICLRVSSIWWNIPTPAYRLIRLIHRIVDNWSVRGIGRLIHRVVILNVWTVTNSMSRFVLFDDGLGAMGGWMGQSGELVLWWKGLLKQLNNQTKSLTYHKGTTHTQQLASLVN